MKALVQGARKFIHQDKVRHLSVPQYKGLNIETVLKESLKYPEVAQYLPEDDDLKRVPR